jgi:glycosyltransferase involved in cell wall biosynthesis
VSAGGPGHHGETLFVPLGDTSARPLPQLLDLGEPVVFPLAHLADRRRRILLDGDYHRLVLSGAPPEEELGYGLAPLVAALGRPKDVALVDLEHGEVVSQSLPEYLVRSLPSALAQLAVSALLVSAQRAAIPWAGRERTREKLSPELTRLVYLLPSVGVASPVGGAVTHAHEMIRSFEAEGVAVEAFTTNAAICKTAAETRDLPCEWSFVRTPPAAKAIAASAAAGGDLAIVRASLAAARRADAIYQRHARFSLAGAVLSHLTGKPLILEHNGSEVFVERHWMASRTPLRGRIGLCEDAALTAASLIVVVSEVAQRSLVEQGFSPEKLLVNPNGVDAARFAVGGRAEIRRRHEISDDALVIGFVGTFGPWHGTPVLARAFADVAPRLPDAHLILVGSGRELPETLNVLRDAGLAGRVTATGPVLPSEIPLYLDACDVLAAPHVPLADGVEFFGSPTKVFEYMASGKAIVASALGQLRDVLRHRETAWLTEPGSELELRDALLGLAGDSGLRSKLGARAREQAIVRHGWRRNASRVIAAYADLARGLP